MKEDKKYIYNSGDMQIVTSGTGNIIRVVPKYDMRREQGLPEVGELSEEEIDKGLLQGECCEQLLRVGDWLKCNCGSESHQIGGEGITGVTDCKGRAILTVTEIPLRLRLHEDGYFGKCTSNHTRMLRYNDECHPLIIGDEWIQPEENLTAENERLVCHEKSKLACRFFGTISSDETVSEYEVGDDYYLIDITGLITLDTVTFLKDVMAKVDRPMSQEKLDTAIALTNSILNDAELRGMGADVPWICGAVANMLLEGQPGMLENYHYSSQNPEPQPEYLTNAIEHGYDKLYDINNGNLSYANTIADLDAAINCTKPEHKKKEEGKAEKENCGFGYGMFQWTYTRTAGAMGVLNDFYGTRTDKLSFEELYVAEYDYFKKEITGKDYKSLLTEYKPTENRVDDAREAGVKFRRVYEKNKGGLDKAEDLAEAWQKELERIGVE